MRIPRPTQSNTRISLTSILRRRKATLRQWSIETGIGTYEQLVRYCKLIGAEAPALAEWSAVRPGTATVQTEGIVHIDVEPMLIIDEHTGEPQQSSNDLLSLEPTFVEPLARPTKTRVRRT